MATGPLMKVEVDVTEAHELSVELLEQFQEDSIDTGVAAFALIMTLGRVISPNVVSSAEDEIKFMQAVMEFCGAYFGAAEGVAN